MNEASYLCVGAKCGNCQLDPVTFSQSQLRPKKTLQATHSSSLLSESSVNSVLHNQGEIDNLSTVDESSRSSMNGLVNRLMKIDGL